MNIVHELISFCISGQIMGLPSAGGEDWVGMRVQTRVAKQIGFNLHSVKAKVDAIAQKFGIFFFTDFYCILCDRLKLKYLLAKP